MPVPRLENRLPPEGINASHDNPLKEFVWLTVGAIGVIVALVVIVSFAAQWIAPRIPYRYEARLVEAVDLTQPPKGAHAQFVQLELQALADRIAQEMGMPEGMNVRVGYRDEDVVNAFATLGGQTVFFRGLLAKLDSEDALAMVMAHEIAHLKHRHPAAALGRGVAIGVVLSMVSAELGRNAAGGAIGQAGLLTVLSFNRDQEREADEEALRVVSKLYGHVGGAVDLFDAFLTLPGAQRDSAVPTAEFLQTHPLTASRMNALKFWAVQQQVALDGPRRPLPPAVSAVRTAAKKEPAKKSS